MDDRQLGWVQKNRTPKDRAAHVGAVAKQFLESPAVAGPKWRRRLTALLEEHAGPELLEHAEVVNARGGVLTFRVDEPAVLYHLRVQWEQRLLDVLRICLPDAGIREVRFTVRRESAGD